MGCGGTNYFIYNVLLGKSSFYMNSTALHSKTQEPIKTPTFHPPWE
jgi:hypothetical protein